MMELEGDGERGFEPAFTIFAPCQERIVDYAVLVDNAIEFRTCHSRCADFGGIIVQEVLAGLDGGLCQMNVIGIEPLQIVGNGNVAETKLTLDAALPTHQHKSILNFSPRRRLALHSRVTSKVFVSVTIGMGEFIHNLNAFARVVSLGSSSFFIFLGHVVCADEYKKTAEYLGGVEVSNDYFSFGCSFL